MRTPKTVYVSLHDLMLLLLYRWSAATSPEVGELGTLTYEDVVHRIDARSSVEIAPRELEDLIYHMKQCVFEKVKPAKLEFGINNHNKVMRRLQQSIPALFKEAPSGEIVMVELEDRVYEN